eukprot:2946817-Alexandrium_andersonii.AAC.1
MSASLVGSEMCIRDRSAKAAGAPCDGPSLPAGEPPAWTETYQAKEEPGGCLLYTSDAADDM